MSRKNIFEIRVEKINYNQVLINFVSRINYTRFMNTDAPFQEFNIEGYADVYFPRWKQSEVDLSIWQFRNSVGITQIIEKSNVNMASEQDLLIYLEYILNIYKIIELYVGDVKYLDKFTAKDKGYYIRSNKEEYLKIKEDIERLIDELGYKIEFDEYKEKVVIIEG